MFWDAAVTRFHPRADIRGAESVLHSWGLKHLIEAEVGRGPSMICVSEGQTGRVLSGTMWPAKPCAWPILGLTKGLCIAILKS